MKKVIFLIALLTVFVGLFTLAQPVVQTATSVTKVFFEPAAGEAPFINAINSAKENLKIEVYVMTAKDVFASIKSAIRRGVDVRVILDRHPYNMGAQAKYAYEYLNSIGVHVIWAPSRFSYDHAKFMVIDNSTAIFGTSNLTYSGISQNFEADVLTGNSRLVKSLDTVFESDWKNIPAGSIPRETLVLSPGSEEDLTWLINRAQKDLYVSEEEVPEGNTFTALEKAAKRGIDVRLLEPSSNLKDASDRYALASLAVSGVHVGLLKTPYVHAKMVISDSSLVFIGSENVSYTSLYQNREVGAILENGAMISKAVLNFEKLWKKVDLLPAELPTAQTAFLTQIVSSPFDYNGKLVKTIGTIEAVFGPTAFVYFGRGNEIAGSELWLGHVMDSVRQLKIGQTVRIVGSVDRYDGQIEISAVIPPVVISGTFLPLPFNPKIDSLKDYDGLTVMVNGTIKILNDGIYVEGKNGTVKLSSIGNMPKMSDGTPLYVEGIVIDSNGTYEIGATSFHTENEYVPILAKAKVKTNPTLGELRKNPKLYYDQTITSTGTISAVAGSSNMYLVSNGYGMRVYGEHGNAKPGEIVAVRGDFTSYNGSFEIDSNSVKIVQTTSKPQPVSVKTGKISEYPEILIGVTGTVSKAKGNGFYVNDGSGDAYVYMPKGTLPSDGNVVTVTGIAVKYQSNYEIYVVSIE